jgi:hypothetical protein
MKVKNINSSGISTRASLFIAELRDGRQTLPAG